MAARRLKFLPLISVLLMLNSAFGVAARPVSASPDRDGDGIADVVQGSADFDHDGIPDAVEAGIEPGNPLDSDKDLQPDYIDGDSDGDAIADAVEGITEMDGDGIAAFRDVDTDGDRIGDTIEAGTDPAALLDSDGDGTPDLRDLDSDNDGIPDSVETPPVIRNWFDIDRDDDGVPDDEEVNFVEPAPPVDSDGDGTPDYRDLDSDNDGLPDGIDGNIDNDFDGAPDYRDIDTDNDDIPGSVEAGPDPHAPVDTSGGGVPDFRDADSDGDLIPDVSEAGPDPERPIDTDGDGTPDYRPWRKIFLAMHPFFRLVRLVPAVPGAFSAIHGFRGRWPRAFGHTGSQEHGRASQRLFTASVPSMDSFWTRNDEERVAKAGDSGVLVVPLRTARRRPRSRIGRGLDTIRSRSFSRSGISAETSKRFFTTRRTGDPPEEGET